MHFDFKLDPTVVVAGDRGEGESEDEDLVMFLRPPKGSSLGQREQYEQGVAGVYKLRVKLMSDPEDVQALLGGWI